MNNVPQKNDGAANNNIPPKEFGNLQIHAKSDGKLFIDGIFVKNLLLGDNLIIGILTGQHKAEIIYDKFKQNLFFNIKKNQTEELFLYYFDNKQSFENKERSIAFENTELNDAQKKVLDKAFELLGKPSYSKVSVNGKIFMLDCIGYISAVYYSIGFDLQKEISPYRGSNGVTKFFNFLSDKKLIHQNKIPEPGDIVIWDNTWDFNNDNIFGNDPLTHAGIITKVEPDGTIHYAHVHRFLGVVVEKMNLFKPNQQFDANGKEINSPMHAESALNKKRNLPYLSGELWRTNALIIKK